MEFYNELTPYVKEIMKLDLVNLAEFSIEQIQPIINEVIDFLYQNREGGSRTDKKHIVSQSLLRNFAQEPKTHVYVEKVEDIEDYDVLNPVRTDNWIFCLPHSNKDFWSQEIEIFFNPIEDGGANALTHFRKQMDLEDPSKLIEYNVNPLQTIEETRMRLILSLYLAMHIERQTVSKRTSPISDEEFLNEMKILTTSLFFHVWTWCKVDNPTFVVPIKSPIVGLNFYTQEKPLYEYVLPISPTLALFVAVENFRSFIPLEYAYDKKRETDPTYEHVGLESALVNSSEKVGQQKFMIQTGETSYEVYHSNSRLGELKHRDYTFSHDIFRRLTNILKEVYPVHVSSVSSH